MARNGAFSCFPSISSLPPSSAGLKRASLIIICKQSRELHTQLAMESLDQVLTSLADETVSKLWRAKGMPCHLPVLSQCKTRLEPKSAQPHHTHPPLLPLPPSPPPHPPQALLPHRPLHRPLHRHACPRPSSPTSPPRPRILCTSARGCRRSSSSPVRRCTTSTR